MRFKSAKPRTTVQREEQWVGNFGLNKKHTVYSQNEQCLNYSNKQFLTLTEINLKKFDEKNNFDK